MIKPVLSVTEVSRNLSDIINRVAYRGEAFVVERGGRPVAHLVPVPRAGRLGDLSRILDEIPRLPAEDAEDFGRELDEARSRLPVPGDPWES